MNQILLHMGNCIHTKVENLGKSLKENHTTGDMCAILCNSELNTAIAFLALVSIGVTAVPLSLKYSPKHCNRIIENIKPKSLIIDDMDILHSLGIENGNGKNILPAKKQYPCGIFYCGGISQKIYLKVVLAVGGMTKKEIFHICRERLPSYQMPDFIEIIDALPENATGKKERNGSTTFVRE